MRVKEVIYIMKQGIQQWRYARWGKVWEEVQNNNRKGPFNKNADHDIIINNGAQDDKHLLAQENTFENLLAQNENGGCEGCWKDGADYPAPPWIDESGKKNADNTTRIIKSRFHDLFPASKKICPKTNKSD